MQQIYDMHTADRKHRPLQLNYFSHEEKNHPRQIQYLINYKYKNEGMMPPLQ